MKKIIIALVLVMCAGSVKAEPLLDFSSFFQKSRIGYSVDQHLAQSTILYSAVERLHTTPGVEIANLNAGYDMTSKHPVLMIGIRFDNIIPMLWSGAWGKAHVETAELPAVEFGPYASAWPRVDDKKVKMDFWYGLCLAAGFGK